MNKVRVAVNGYGVIGKRVADAVALQEDMALAGVADVVHDYRLQVAGGGCGRTPGGHGASRRRGCGARLSPAGGCCCAAP